MKRALLLATLASLGLGPAAFAQTTISGLVVPGSANPFLAGLPDGTTSGSVDEAPFQSPLLVPGLNFTPGGFFTFSVTGSVDFGGGTPTDSPDGSFDVFHDAENGIGGFHAPANALVGVFLDTSQPDQSPAPGVLDFTSGDPAQLGTSFSVLTPGLKQVFFIGDGLTGTGTGAIQKFMIPTDASRLFLGTVDGVGWFNNSGSFTVNVTGPSASAAAPEPGTIALAGLGLLGLVAARRRRVA